MEKLLLKLVRQLDALDEASLMHLWSKYATLTSRFEPTKQWEEAALIFSLIQAKRWKNQLFNYYWALQSRPAATGGDNPDAREKSLAPGFSLEPAQKGQGHCRVLSFRAREDGAAPK